MDKDEIEKLIDKKLVDFAKMTVGVIRKECDKLRAEQQGSFAAMTRGFETGMSKRNAEITEHIMKREWEISGIRRMTAAIQDKLYKLPFPEEDADPEFCDS